MEKKLVAGKRYMWPTSNVPGCRWVNGLFTGEYKENGNAVLMTKDGEKWSVPQDDCVLMPKR